MSAEDDTDLIDSFRSLYQEYYDEQIRTLADKHPDRRSLYVDWHDIEEFDAEIAEGYVNNPDQYRQRAEKALQLFGHSVEADLEQANVRLQNPPERTEINIREIQSDDKSKLITTRGIVREATEVRTILQHAAFECQRCGTLTYVDQHNNAPQKPYECRGCEQQGPFVLVEDESEFVDSRRFTIAEDPNTLPEDATIGIIDVSLEDDIVDEANAGDVIQLTGAIHLEQTEKDGMPVFEPYVEAHSVDRLTDASEREMLSMPPNNIPDPDIEVYVGTAVQVEATTSKELHPPFDEAATKVKLVTPFVEALGWNIVDNNYVQLGYTTDRTDKKADYALFSGGREPPDVIIEVEEFGEPLDSGSRHSDREYSEPKRRLFEKLQVFSAEWGVLTDGFEFRVFRNRRDNIDDIASFGMNDLPNSVIEHLQPSNLLDTTLDGVDEALTKKPPENTEPQATSGRVIQTGKDETSNKIRDIIRSKQDSFPNGVPVEKAVDYGSWKTEASRKEVREYIERLKKRGSVYEPADGRLRVP